MKEVNKYTLMAKDCGGNINFIIMYAHNIEELEEKYEEEYDDEYDSYTIEEIEHNVLTDEEEEASREYVHEHMED